MNTKTLSSDSDIAEEIKRLIQTFVETGLRLEELTEGQIDTVSSSDGQMFLLRHAQDQLRALEASRQTAILNALPAHIALLDSQGVIVSVNEVWREFADANAFPVKGYGIGLNYLEVCDKAAGAGSAEAHMTAAGIRSLQNGSAQSFSMEYPCDGPTEQCWFQVTATPIDGDASSGTVVMHMNITERKHFEKTLIENEVMLRLTGRMARLGGWSISLPDYRITWSDEICNILNVPFGTEPDVSLALSLFTPQSRETVIKAVEACATHGTAFDVELEVITTEGQLIHIRCMGQAERNTQGVITKLHGALQDISASKLASLRIKYLNRVYSMLSAINTLMVRERDVNELFGAACQIAVDTGGFKMALICVIDPAAQMINLVASSGKNKKLLAAVKRLILSSDGASKTMVASAIREKKAIVSNDSRNDSRVVLREAFAEAGIRSQAVLPLLIADKAIGAIALYSGETGSFHEEELQLLGELARDIAFASDSIDKQTRTDYLAYYDALTGLANRTLFHERVAQYIRGATDGKHQLAVIHVNLERFKNINDSLGRSAGDLLLKLVAQWITNATGDANLLARTGADDFAIVLPHVKRNGNLPKVIENAMKAFMDHAFHLLGADYRISARIGVALFPDDGTNAEALYSNAETALKHTRSKGVRYQFYNKAMTLSVANELTLENQLRRALNNREFVLHYQPKVDLRTRIVTSAEALIRWNDPQLRLVQPGRFMPMLEETGLINEVGHWVLCKAVEDYLRWCDTGLAAVPIAVNVSSLQLKNPRFITELGEAIGIDARAAAGLELEITESFAMEDIRRSIASLQAIRGMGIRIAIDDFGTGFSSLSYLAKLPLDTLKIDRSFIMDMTSGPEGLALVSTIISLGHSLRLNVVAEGVETEEQSQILKSLGCNEIQGFLISPALPAEHFEEKYLSPVEQLVHPL